MITSLPDFYQAAEAALAPVDDFIIQTQATGLLRADHFGYRSATHEEFEAMRRLFEYEAKFFYQSIVSGRPIALIKLKQPIITAAGALHYLELADQKPDGSQKSGFDHVEFFPVSGIELELVTFFNKQGITFSIVDRPHHVTYDFTLPSKLTLRIEPIPLLTKIIEEEMEPVVFL